MKTVKERLLALREAMRERGISAYIVPGTDPHGSEYIPAYWKEREWISGFTGSAGTAVVLLEDAGLWTDSRYFLQADAELANSGIVLFKDGVTGTPSINQWLMDQLEAGAVVGVNPEMFSVNAYATMESMLTGAGVELTTVDLIKQIWTENRPKLSTEPFYVLDVAYSGQAVADKLSVVRAEMAKVKADVYVLSALDEIAWLFNIRGTDVDYNPVVIAYATVTSHAATLFVDQAKLTDELRAYFAQSGVTLAHYADAIVALQTIDTSEAVLCDGARMNRALYDAIPAACQRVMVLSPVTQLKSVKNHIELEGVRRAMVQDGVALVRFFSWLEQAVQTEQLTECDVMRRLTACRAQGVNFKGESFGTIAGYNTNGAIVHYHAVDGQCATLASEGMLLLDSGGQYLDGTTDITRTVTLGDPSAQQMRDYTLVLKGHLAISRVKFPQGTRGAQLDALARQFLWGEGLTYTHGTGHGVGHFLCVHEGPQGIRLEENPTVLQVGMMLSNEPGVYRTGEYGIRTENLVVVAPDQTTDLGEFLRFDTLTLYPYDRRLIALDLLTADDKAWINEYHARVYAALSPLLTRDEQAWLADKCAELH